MHEDDIYRTSTQYRVWSYTPSGLESLRSTTNAHAAEKVRAAIKRTRISQGIQNGGENNSATDRKTDDDNVKCLTVEEELKIVRWGCGKIMEIGEIMEPPIPIEIRATATQYLQRFYLTYSPMDYHPRQIMTSALFLATKSDHFYIPLSHFISKLPNTGEDDVKAPEFTLMQGLRFTLDVRHPFKGLEGGVMEMLALVQEGMLKNLGAEPKRRIGKAADKAFSTLKGPVQMTDSYFLYTPGQIWLAALMIADKELATTYLDLKFRALDSSEADTLRKKLLPILTSCSTLLLSYKSQDDDPTERKEMKRIGRKLHLCQNPERLNIVEMNRSQKRDSDDPDPEKAEKKRRKMEGKNLKNDGDVFGGALKDVER
ncbi:MAG: hypothetical protein Q9160_005353 [Pyrenula sp. 1 TL-2023]